MTLYRESQHIPIAVVILLIATILVLIYLFHSIDRYHAEGDEDPLLQHSKYYVIAATNRGNHA